MLQFKYHRRFQKHFDKLPKRIRQLAAEKVDFFLSDPFHPSLETHKLHTNPELWAFSINRNYRVVFNFYDQNSIIFHDIGTHKIYARL